MDLSAGMFATLLVVIGLLALIVSVVTEVIKDVVFLSKIPTDIRIIVLSLVLTLYAYFAYISYSGKAIIWYYVVATIIAGFVVAYVVMYGWDKLAQLYKKFRNIPTIDKTEEPMPSATLLTYTDEKDLTSGQSQIPLLKDNSLSNMIESTTDTLSSVNTTESDNIISNINTTYTSTSDASTSYNYVSNASTSDTSTSYNNVSTPSTSDTTT